MASEEESPRTLFIHKIEKAWYYIPPYLSLDNRHVEEEAPRSERLQRLVELIAEKRHQDAMYLPPLVVRARRRYVSRALALRREMTMNDLPRCPKKISFVRRSKTPVETVEVFRDLGQERDLTTPIYFYTNTSVGLERFRRIVHGVMTWVRLYQYHSSQVKTILRYFANCEVQPDVEGGDNSFSMSSFKANTQAKLSHVTLEILKNDPAQRRAEDIRPVETGLCGYAAIADLSKDVINQLAWKAWYQEFEPSSVIVREGDWPMYYYFILSGSLIVSVIDREKMKANVVCTLSRGETFGELSIAYGTRRNSTVVAKERTGLLILVDTDYKKIFMDCGLRLLTAPFLQSIPCFDRFPVDILKNKPTFVKFSFFKKNQVLVEDSNISPWLFLIKSGSARVIMPVRKTALAKAEEIAAEATGIGTTQGARKEQPGDTIKTGNLWVMGQRHPPSPLGKVSTKPLQPHESVLRRLMNRKILDNEDRRQVMLTMQELTLPLGKIKLDEEFGDSDRDSGLRGKKLPHVQGAHFRRISRANAKISLVKDTDDTDISFWDNNETIQGKRTLATDLNADYYRTLHMREKRERQVYITIQRLFKNNVFGLTEYLFENEPSLKLVSEGCECIMIHKDLYWENIPNATVVNLTNSMRPYPQESDVVARKVEQLRWKELRNEVLENTVLTMERKYCDLSDPRVEIPPKPSF